MFGASETVVGGAATIGGIAAAPETLGASLAVSFAGVGAVAHGTMVTGNSIRHLATGNNYGEHGNSKSSTKEQHNYDIKDTQTGKTVKTGTSGGKLTKTGESYRGNSQANKWNKQEGTPGRYKSETTNKVPAGKGAREKALDYEKAQANKLRDQLDPNKHKRP